MKLLLIRHTTVDVPKGMIYGQLDVPLASSFDEEAKKINAQIDTDFDMVYSSPLTRCAQLAQKISSIVSIDKRLMELDFGDWEGKYWNDIDQNAEAQKWFADFVNTSTPKGESYIDLMDRCRLFLNEITSEGHKKVCIVSHGGTIRAFLSLIEGITPDKAFDRKVEYGEVIQITLSQQFIKS